MVRLILARSRSAPREGISVATARNSAERKGSGRIGFSRQRGTQPVHSTLTGSRYRATVRPGAVSTETMTCPPQVPGATLQLQDCLYAPRVGQRASPL